MKILVLVLLPFATAWVPLLHQPLASSTALRATGKLLEIKTGRSQLDPAVIHRYQDLPFPSDKVLAEYVWVDAVGTTRSKTRTLAKSKVRHTPGSREHIQVQF